MKDIGRPACICRPMHPGGLTMRRWLVLLALLVFAPSAFSQDVDYREELRFVEALRARGDVDLAEEMLKKLEATAPPAFKKELPLELAKTHLRQATEQPDLKKRRELYKQAQAELQAFITKNPGHPRVAEANLDIARVYNLSGKAELASARLKEDVAERKAAITNALASLKSANERLVSAEKALETIRDKLEKPDGIADPAKKKAAILALRRAEEDVNNITLERAVNLYDQAEALEKLGKSADS